jgi:murein DD-endopeptidase MepM/ murein hydrolase activator NlpD
MLTTLKVLAVVLVLGLLVPQHGVIPVQEATAKDWNPHSFWYAPWGKSGVHKGIDIFAKPGKSVVASTSGVVIFTGNISMGGNVVAILGPQWRIHYYAHLQQVTTKPLAWASQGDTIGLVGNTGNAAGKPPHLHYSVYSLIPYPWRFSFAIQGWKKMFFMNPVDGFVANG